VTIVGERVVLAMGRSLKLDEHKDLVTAIENRVRDWKNPTIQEGRKNQCFTMQV